MGGGIERMVGAQHVEFIAELSVNATKELNIENGIKGRVRGQGCRV